MGYIYHDTLDREETGMQVTKLKEMTVLSKMSLLPGLFFFQMPAHFSITQETSQGSMSLPFPWSICTIIAAALLDYLQFIPEGPVRQSPNALYKGSLRTENSSVPWPSHTCCARSSCTFMLLIDLACKYLLCWNQSCILHIWSFQVLPRRLWDLICTESACFYWMALAFPHPSLAKLPGTSCFYIDRHWASIGSGYSHCWQAVVAQGTHCSHAHLWYFSFLTQLSSLLTYPLCSAVKELPPFQPTSGWIVLGDKAACCICVISLNWSNPNGELFHYYECWKRPHSRTRSSCLESQK